MAYSTTGAKLDIELHWNDADTVFTHIFGSLFLKLLPVLLVGLSS